MSNDNVNKCEKQFWETKLGPTEEDYFIRCEDDCGCVKSCKKTPNVMCNCTESEDDICPNCLDSCMDDLWQRMIDGTAGKNTIDCQLNIKRMLINMIKDPAFIFQTEKEICVLEMLREKQQFE